MTARMRSSKSCSGRLSLPLMKCMRLRAWRHINKTAACAIGRPKQTIRKRVKNAQAAARTRALLNSGYSTDLAAFYALTVLHDKRPALAEKLVKR